MPPLLPATEPTPKKLFLDRMARSRIETVAAARDEASRDGLEFIAAYSMKTNPDERIARLAREHGMYAEVISDEELRYALHCGFGPGRVVRNGPEPAWKSTLGVRLPFCFADSLEAFAANAARGVSDVAGVRLRPLRVTSRFGVPSEEDARLCAAIAEATGTAAVAVSMHVRRSDYNGASWRDLCTDLISRAQRLEREGGRPLVALDVGGAWDPGTFEGSFLSDARWLAERVCTALPAAKHVIIEPGQAIAMPVEVLVTRVLEVRRRAHGTHAVLDAGFNDWPEQHRGAHGFFVLRNGGWRRLERGRDVLCGKTCLEWDEIEGIAVPADLAPGDVVLITNVGAYDTSMAFPFASGSRAHATAEGFVA